jgi:protein BCP1
MSDNKKRKKDDSSSEEAEQEDVVVDFIFVDPAEIDYHMVKNLATDLIDDPTFNNRELAELVVSTNNPVGSVIKIEGEDDGVGYITVLPAHKYRDKQCIQQLLAFVEQHAQQGGVLKDTKQGALWQKVLRSERLGIVLNQRLLNVPDELVPHLHLYLHREIERCVQAGQKSYDFEYYLLVTSQFTVTKQLPDEDEPPKKKRRVSQELKIGSVEWYRFEEESYAKYAEGMFSCERKRPTSESEEDKMTLAAFTKDSRVFMVLTRDQINKKVIPHMKSIAVDPEQAKPKEKK